MDKRPILFLDSGIGGIPYCRHFYQRNSTETIYYLADREHFPYGTREREELAALLTATMKKIVKTVNPKIAVLACNTATVSALAELRHCFPELPFVGTVPAVKPAMLAGKTGKVGVLGTERTVKDPYIRELANSCGNADASGGEIFCVAAPELVEFVERRIMTADENEKKEMAKKYIGLFRAAGAGTVVLGCTHFLFLLEEFRREAEPLIKVFDSMDGITHRIESLLDDNDHALRSENNEPGQNRLLLTGADKPEASWQSLADQLGFGLSLLDKI